MTISVNDGMGTRELSGREVYLATLIARLDDTGAWWMIGRGKNAPAEPLFGCVIQEPTIGGKRLAAAESNNFAKCIEDALTQFAKQ